jgi:hypothetical protein
VSLWRHLAAGGLKDQERVLTLGMRTLKDRRDGEGRWRAYPFHYTLLALTEIEVPAVRAELGYAAPQCEKLLKRSPRGEVYDQRRRCIAERVLAKC